MDRFIDAAVEQFARDHTEPETDLYLRLREETYRVMQRPQMQVDVIEGRFLQMLVRLSGAKSILELGMFTGYSALMMAEALPDDGHLITCEIDAKAEAIARRYVAESPQGDKITIRMGPALDTIKTLAAPLDLVFIDADKVNYSSYYEACLPLLKPGGWSWPTMSCGAAKCSIPRMPMTTRSSLSTTWCKTIVASKMFA